MKHSVSLGSVTVFTDNANEHDTDYYVDRLMQRIHLIANEVGEKVPDELRMVITTSVQAIQLAERARIAAELNENGQEIAAQMVSRAGD